MIRRKKCFGKYKTNTYCKEKCYENWDCWAATFRHTRQGQMAIRKHEMNLKEKQRELQLKQMMASQQQPHQQPRAEPEQEQQDSYIDMNEEEPNVWEFSNKIGGVVSGSNKKRKSKGKSPLPR